MGNIAANQQNIRLTCNLIENRPEALFRIQFAVNVADRSHPDHIFCGASGQFIRESFGGFIFQFRHEVQIPANLLLLGFPVDFIGGVLSVPYYFGLLSF
jgi:hypothetical protein